MIAPNTINSHAHHFNPSLPLDCCSLFSSSPFVRGAFVALTGNVVVVPFVVVGIFDGTLDGISLLGAAAVGLIVGSKMLTVGKLTISGIGANVNLVGAGTATGNANGLLVIGFVDRGTGIGAGIGDDIGACGCILIGVETSKSSVKPETSMTTFVADASNGTIALFCSTDCSAN